jgi:hypothetical protein
MGCVTGIVGAGGNVGATCFNLAFRQLDDYRTAYLVMGSTILVSSLLSALIFIDGQNSLWTSGNMSEEDSASIASNPHDALRDEAGEDEKEENERDSQGVGSSYRPCENTKTSTFHIS